MNFGNRHEFRSTFHDWSVEATSFPSEVVEMALDHVIKGRTGLPVGEEDLPEKRRQQLMEACAQYSQES